MIATIPAGFDEALARWYAACMRLAHDQPHRTMLEITDPARQLIRSAFRRGRVLVIEAPWRGYTGTIALVARWIGAEDDRRLTDHVRVGDGDWIYLRTDLTALVHRERIVLERHSILGLWPGIAVRRVAPVPLPVPIARDPGR